MNEKELVKWFAPNIRTGLQNALAKLDEAETFDELDAFRKQLLYLSKDLKGNIKLMRAYNDVRACIEMNTKDQPD